MNVRVVMCDSEVDDAVVVVVVVVWLIAAVALLLRRIIIVRMAVVVLDNRKQLCCVVVVRLAPSGLSSQFVAVRGITSPPNHFSLHTLRLLLLVSLCASTLDTHRTNSSPSHPTSTSSRLTLLARPSASHNVSHVALSLDLSRRTAYLLCLVLHAMLSTFRW